MALHANHRHSNDSPVCILQKPISDKGEKICHHQSKGHITDEHSTPVQCNNTGTADTIPITDADSGKLAGFIPIKASSNNRLNQAKSLNDFGSRRTMGSSGQQSKRNMGNKPNPTSNMQGLQQHIHLSQSENNEFHNKQHLSLSTVLGRLANGPKMV